MSERLRATTTTSILAALVCANPVSLIVVGAPWYLCLGIPIATAVLLLCALRRWSGRLPAVYAVNVLALGGLWLNAEAVVRTRFHDYVVEDLYEQHGDYYFNRPYLSTRLRDKEYAVDYLTNRDGYRVGPSQDVERTVTEVDWLVLGDSYTQGAQVTFEELYSTRLYRHFPDRIVLNAGVSGWGLYEELAFLRARGASLRPKVVLLQISNFNDFMKVVPRRAGVSDYLMQASEVVRLLLQDIKYTNPTDLPLGRWVEPFYKTDEENRRYNVFYRRTSPEKETDLEAVRSVISDIASLTRQLGAQLVVVQVPTKEQVSFKFLEEAVGGLHIDPALLDLERPNRLIRTLADSLGFLVVDPLSEWRSAKTFPFFLYDEHLTADGHEMLAGAVISTLAANGTASRVQVLSTSYAGDRYPQFTAQGDTIVFHSPRNGHSEILEADIDTWTERRITIDDSDESHPVIVPNGGGLLFVVGDGESGRTRIWRSDRFGRSAVPLEELTTAFGAIPAVFPDGRQVVFPSWGPKADAETAALVLFSLAGGKRDTLPTATSQVWRPVVHPTGHFIAYIGRVSGQYEVFELDLRTRKTRRLTTTPWDEWDPAYTPDGRSLIYAARPDANWDLFRLHRDRPEPERLTRTRGDEWDPQVTPDGRRIAFGGEYGLFRGIYLIPLAR